MWLPLDQSTLYTAVTEVCSSICPSVCQHKYSNYVYTYIAIRFESGSDDPDNLGHLFGGSSGSHLQTKLSGCDLDITCCLENSVAWHLVSE